MHYRSWVFLVLFGIAGVSAAEEPTPQNPCETPGSADSEAGNPKSHQKKCASSSGKAYVPPKPSPSSTPERLAMSDIMAVVIAHKPAILRCVKAQKKEEPDRSGRLEMSWKIRKKGTTWDVKCNTPELCKTLLAHCLMREIKEWTFPRHKIEGDPIRFPFTF